MECFFSVFGHLPLSLQSKASPGTCSCGREPFCQLMPFQSGLGWAEASWVLVQEPAASQARELHMEALRGTDEDPLEGLRQGKQVIPGHHILLGIQEGIDWNLSDLCNTKRNGEARSYCIAQGTLLNVTWPPGWKMGLEGKWTHVCMYGWVPPLCAWNHHNVVNWLYSNIK